MIDDPTEAPVRLMALVLAAVLLLSLMVLA